MLQSVPRSHPGNLARARRGGINALDFVTIVKLITPTISIPEALMAWLNAPRSDLPPSNRGTADH